MASRKEQKEQLKAERLEAERHAQAEERRKRMVGGGIAAALLIVLAAGVIYLVATSGGGDSGNAHIADEAGFTTTAKAKPDERAGTETKPGELASNLNGAAKAAGCKLADPADEGNRHMQPDEAAKYRSNPPTSGNHDPVPLADGAYRTTPALRHTVHSMEHGRVLIQYSPKLPPATQLKLKGVFDESFRYIALFPNPEMPYQVAATAWGHLLGCPRYGDKALDAIRAFRDSYVGQGPEGVGSQPSA